MKIKNIKAREVVDSRGEPTLRVYLETDNGFFTSGVPSGASTGDFEAVELRDEDRLFGKGVKKAVKKVEETISPALEGMSVENQKQIDEKMIELDGTDNKSNLGANSLLGVSMSVLKAAAYSRDLSVHEYVSDLSGFQSSMPRPLLNVINGGSHTGGGVDFQEFMLAPEKDSFKKNLFQSVKVYHRLKKKLQTKNTSWLNVGDEGGFVPELETPEEVLSLLEEVTEMDFVLDVAASEFFTGAFYDTQMGKMSTDEMIDYYKQLIDKYPIIGLEDPLEENDFKTWNKLNEELSKQLVIGDDLLVTNPDRIKEALRKQSCNAMILKVNQIGTITESLQAAQLAKDNNWKLIVSHRSGETTDPFIADFAVGIGSQFIKTGAPARGERVVKYNRLLEIEEELN